MKSTFINKILKHPDKDEIISRLLMNEKYKDVSSWLKNKYSAITNNDFVFSEKDLKTFHENYLDIYNELQKDYTIAKNNPIDFSNKIKKTSAYKQKMLELASKELDIKEMITNMVVAIECRTEQLFNKMQEDPDDTKLDKTLLEWFDKLGVILEKYHKLVISPEETMSVTNNIMNVSVLSQHINVFHDVIKEVVEKFDVETSLQFIDLFNSKLNALSNKDIVTLNKTDERFEEAKLLTDSMNEKLNEK